MFNNTTFYMVDVSKTRARPLVQANGGISPVSGTGGYIGEIAASDASSGIRD